MYDSKFVVGKHCELQNALEDGVSSTLLSSSSPVRKQNHTLGARAADARGNFLHSCYERGAPPFFLRFSSILELKTCPTPKPDFGEN